jgi:hypothetical protein
MSAQPVNGSTPQVPPVDPANVLLDETPTIVSVGDMMTARGKRVVITFRTPSTTFTAILEREFALGLGQQLVSDAQSLGGLIVPPSGGIL